MPFHRSTHAEAPSWPLLSPHVPQLVHARDATPRTRARAHASGNAAMCCCRSPLRSLKFFDMDAATEGADARKIINYDDF